MPNNLNMYDILELAEELTTYTAKRIAEEIDAGSERDAVTEDLQEFFIRYVAGWSNDPQFTERFEVKLVDNILGDLNRHAMEDFTTG
jgi:hypothetical protein